MPSTDDIYSNYLTAEHVKECGGSKVTVIKNVYLKDFNGRQKLVLTLDGLSKTMVVNATNAGAIAKIANTKDYTKWVGVAIELVVSTVQFKDDMFEAIRVKAPKKASDALAFM